KSVAAQAHQVIERVYPRRLNDLSKTSVDTNEAVKKGVPLVVTNPHGGVVLAFDEAGLVTLATKLDCVIEMVPQVGNFVAPGDPLFRVYGSTANFLVQRLQDSVAIGAERTMEQDPAFAF